MVYYFLPTSVIQLTASDEKCKLVHQSMLMTEVLAYLPRIQVIALQRLNGFWYTKAVSRVQTRYKLPCPPIYFTTNMFQGDSSKTLFIYFPEQMRVKRLQRQIFDFKNYATIHVAADTLYAYLEDTYEKKWLLYSGIAKDKITMKVKAKPLKARQSAVLVNYQGSHIFAMSGFSAKGSLAFFEYFSTTQNTWTVGPEL